jgi:hypothetical protein
VRRDGCRVVRICPCQDHSVETVSIFFHACEPCGTCASGRALQMDRHGRRPGPATRCPAIVGCHLLRVQVACAYRLVLGAGRRRSTRSYSSPGPGPDCSPLAPPRLQPTAPGGCDGLKNHGPSSARRLVRHGTARSQRAHCTVPCAARVVGASSGDRGSSTRQSAALTGPATLLQLE